MTGDSREQGAWQDTSRLRLRGPYTPDGRPRSDRQYRPLFWGMSYDWAGKAILNRYLTGGGDWNIYHDLQWREYMMENELLRAQLLRRTTNLAITLARQGQGRHSFSEQFSAEIENGEDIIGYQYLHGTNANAGGFRLWGSAMVQQGYNGIQGYHLVAMHANYQWNDRIDPNPQYTTDSIKNTFAEIISLGVAEPYNISITWMASCRISFALPGGTVEVKGYPGDRPWL